MIIVEYIGKTENVGRFGIINKGAKLTMYEHEAEVALKHPHFKMIENLAEQRHPQSGSITPKESISYNLTQVTWSKGNLFPFLAAKSHNTIRKIASALNEIGCNLNLNSEKLALADDIYSEVKRHGWTQPDYAIKKRTPVIPATPPVDEAKKQDDKKEEPKSDELNTNAENHEGESFEPNNSDDDWGKPDNSHRRGRPRKNENNQ